MTTPQAVTLGLTANELSKKITGQNHTSAGRSAVAAGTGAALGYGAATAATALVTVAAPVAIPITLATAGVAFIASLFD